jgi:hypothetical protein
MPRSTPLRTAAPFVAVAAILAVALQLSVTRPPAEEVARGGPAADAGLQREQEEKQEKVERKLEALEEAVAEGRAGQRRPVAMGAAAGWAGEVPVDTTNDDWEPAIAADPNGPYVYVLVTRYAPKPCSGNCPSPWIAIERSTDGGATWTTGAPLCACKGSGQFDPIIEVVPSNGNVYAVYMNGFNVVFTKSTNRGASWSTPVPTYGKVSWNDKPVLAMSDDGRDVYISWNGPTSGDAWVAQSHDSGATWTQAKVADSDRYYFAFDADVAPDGVVYFSEGALDYSNGGGNLRGPIEQRVLISRDRGATWENRLVDSVELGLACTAAGCSPDYYLGHSAITVDATGKVVVTYDGATADGGPQTIWVRRSSDAGLTWTARTAVSTVGEEATQPMIEARGSGDVRLAWLQTSGGANVDAWNAWYRRSSDGGATWTAPVKISDSTGGAGYKTAAGFAEVYGDYGEIAITSAGKTIAIWGEGYSYDGPGAAWFNREL